MRENPRLFMNVRGHEVPAQKAGAARVVTDFELYVVVEKIGRAGELVERQDELATEL